MLYLIIFTTIILIFDMSWYRFPGNMHDTKPQACPLGAVSV